MSTDRRELLAQVGKLLFGERWQTDLAKAADVDSRTVRRWVAGAYPIPDGVFLDLHRQVQERAQDLDDVEPALKQAASAGVSAGGRQEG